MTIQAREEMADSNPNPNPNPNPAADPPTTCLGGAEHELQDLKDLVLDGRCDGPLRRQVAKELGCKHAKLPDSKIMSELDDYFARRAETRRLMNFRRWKQRDLQRQQQAAAAAAAAVLRLLRLLRRRRPRRRRRLLRLRSGCCTRCRVPHMSNAGWRWSRA